DYLPDDTYFAVIEQGFDLDRLTDQAVTIIEVADIFRFEPSLAGLIAQGGATDRLVISYSTDLDAATVMAALQARGVAIQAHRDYSRQLDITLDPARLREVLALPFIQFAGLPPEEPTLDGYDHRNASGRANYLNTGYNSLNYNGAGVVVGIGESGTVDSLVDVKGRLTEMESGASSSHKIGVMQNAGGAGNLDPSNRNNAWGATFLSVVGSPDYAALYSSHNLRYTNHSYGVAISGGYDQSARDHDLRIATYPNHLVIYSSGNSGDEQGYAPYNFAGCPGAPSDCWANITGQMKQNKDMFAIGALELDDDLTSFSSRGPMYDGRIIPQLVIEGIEGTSDAAPKVTGEVAMLAQVYKAKNSGSEPTSSLLRAIMMNTADDLGNAGPDFKHGYGRPNLRRAYNVIDNAQFLTGSVSHGGTNSHTITVPANTKQVRVMIVWPDVAAAVSANPAIVNNLDLVAKDPSNVSYNPWVLDHSASVAAISAAATRSVDSRNTIEQVTLDDPASGNWTMEVSGTSVPTGPQTYYLTYEFLTDELTMMFPLKDHRFVSGTAYHLKWDSYGASGTFSLDYRLDGGSWTSITSGYSATSRTYQWTAPSVTGIHTIEFRVQRSALTATSDVNYLGPAAENFRIFSVCSDVVILKWGAVSGATAYKVYRLGAMVMEEVTSNITFDGASATLTGQSTVNTEYYAVSAVTGSNEGQRTMAAEKAPGDYSCGGINWTGAVSTDWFTTGNWSTSAVPTSADNVVIPSSPSNQPVINAAGAVCNNMTIETGASLTMSAATAYTLSVAGDWTNNGTFTSGIGTVEFNSTNAYQGIGGTSTTNFNILSVTKGAKDRILEAASLITLNAAVNPLVLTSGTFKLSSASTLLPFTSGPSIGSTAGFWNNGGTINAGSYSWTLNAGLLRISAGTVNVGASSGNSITYLNNGTLIMEGGALNIAGRFSPNSGTSTGTFTQLGGIITVNTVGSTSTSRAPFELNSGVPFTMNGGTIVVRRASSNAADVIVLSTTYEVTGGALQIGDASTPAGQTIRVNSIAPVYNLIVNATNSPTAQLVTNGLTVKKDVTIAGGTLNANGLNMNVGGNWTNNGAFTAGAGTVTFNGATAQTIGGSVDTTFAYLTINNTAGVSLGRPALVNNQLTLTSGLLTLGGYNLTMGASASAISG
ncbi:MAG: S8 family serine peptidase, partial [Anaerolineae bacterium]